MVKTILNVEGMMCMNCEKHMNNAIKDNFNVESVAASKDSCQVEIVSAEAIDEAKVKEVVSELGFEYKGMTIA